MGELENPRVMSKLIELLSSMLERVAQSNDDAYCRQNPDQWTVFDGLSRPTISIRNYLERIFKYANCSPCCFILAYVYLDRLVQRQPSLAISSVNVHRLLITAVMVAAKFMDDMCYNNGYYAKIGGISRAEMNFLEVDFLFGVGFELNVTPNTFHTYCAYLRRQLLSLTNLPPTTTTTTDTAADEIKLLHSRFNDEESASHSHHNQLAAAV